MKVLVADDNRDAALSLGALITLIGAGLFQFFMNTVIDETQLQRFAGEPVPALPAE